MERMARKGISPLVATVLLIAATMSIAMILSFWASSFVRTTLPTVNATQQQCQFADFTVYQCSYSLGNKTLDITLQNLRNVPLNEMIVQLFFVNNTVSQPINLTNTLPGGVYQSFRLTNTESTFSKIIVKSLACAGTVADKEQVCTTTA